MVVVGYIVKVLISALIIISNRPKVRGRKHGHSQ